MDRRVLFVRVTLVTGAILDAFFAVALMSPKLTGMIVLGIESYQADAMTMYMMNVAAALMAGWTGVLFWASVRPIERRGIIPITLFPLLPGLIAAGLVFYGSGAIPLARILPLLMISVILMVAQALGYVMTRNQSVPATRSK